MAETVLNPQESKIDPSEDAQRNSNQIKKIVGIILSLVMIALTIFVLNLEHQNSNTLAKSAELALIAGNRATINYKIYVGRYKATKLKLEETKIQLDETTSKLEQVDRQLDQVSAELATTKSMLSQTQGMLVSAQDENTKLKQDLQGLDDLQNSENVQNIGELQTKIKTLKDKDSQISVQLDDLKNQMRIYAAEFSNLDEGKSLIVLFQSKIRLVKMRMHHLKQEAFLARVQAQKEKDRIASLNGNSGFVLRNGQVLNPNSTKKSFAIDVNNVQ